MDMKMNPARETETALAVLPGLLCDSRMFGSQVAAFGAQVIDGFYGGAASIAAMAEYAIERLPARCVLLGHSMGARVALEVWRLAPERVQRLILADTGVHKVRPGEADARYALRDLGRRQGAAALVDAWLPPMIGPAHRGDAHLYAVLRDMAIDAGTDTYEAQVHALLNRPDAERSLDTVSCPLLAVVGRDDAWSPVSQHEDIVAQVTGAQLRVVENAGHMAPAEEPERFNAVLREWLLQPSERYLDR